MTACMGKNCSFGLLYMSIVNVCELVSSFPFGFDGGMWVLIVLIPDRCLSIYFISGPSLSLVADLPACN